MDASGAAWFGVFAEVFPPLGSDDMCSMLCRLALSFELVSGVNFSRVSKLDAFWSYLNDYSSLETGAKDEVTARTMLYLQTLGERHVE